MNFIENINYATGKAIDEGGKYAKLTAEYAKLKLFQQISYSFSFVAKMVIIGAFIFMALLFLLVAATVAIGNALGSFVARHAYYRWNPIVDRTGDLRS